VKAHRQALPRPFQCPMSGLEGCAAVPAGDERTAKPARARPALGGQRQTHIACRCHKESALLPLDRLGGFSRTCMKRPMKRLLNTARRRSGASMPVLATIPTSAQILKIGDPGSPAMQCGVGPAAHLSAGMRVVTATVISPSNRRSRATGCKGASASRGCARHLTSPCR
jgi:hypothetical protein